VQQTAIPSASTDSRAVRRARWRAHVYRSLGVGTFTAWAVTIDRWASGTSISAWHWTLVFALAAAAWFLVGAGSGVLWQYLPRPRAESRRPPHT